MLRRLVGSRGAAAVEYALIVAAVAAVLIVVAISFQDELTNVLRQSCEATAEQNLDDDPDC